MEGHCLRRAVEPEAWPGEAAGRGEARGALEQYPKPLTSKGVGRSPARPNTPPDVPRVLVRMASQDKVFLAPHFAGGGHHLTMSCL